MHAPTPPRFPWLEGRHGALAAITLPCAVICATLLPLALPGPALHLPAYLDRVCLPDPSGARDIHVAYYVGCPAGTSQTTMTVPPIEVLCVALVAATLVLISPRMAFWEQFDRKRMFVHALPAALLAVSTPLGAGLAVAPATGASDPVMLTAMGNTLVDTTLILTGMAVLGSFHGLGAGTLLTLVDILSQGAQAPTGFTLRFYPPNTPGTAPPAILLAITLATATLALLAWSYTGGKGLTATK